LTDEGWVLLLSTDSIDRIRCEFDFEKAFDQIHKPRKRLQMNDECEKCLDQRKCTLADMKNDYEFKERFPYIYIKNFGYPDPERFTP